MKAPAEKQPAPKNAHLQQNFFNQSTAGSFFGPNTIQPKLTIGQPNDQYEQEADAMADKVVRGESAAMSTNNVPGVQTMCAGCAEEESGVQRMAAPEELEEGAPAISKKGIEEEEMPGLQTKPLLMRKTQNGSSVGTPALASQLSSSRGGGQAMPTSTNQQMSQSFGTDFSGVRIHTDSQASEMNQGLSARAFTHGTDVYFNHGEYSPGSSEGKRLLAHELTHVVQQGGNKHSKENNAEYFGSGGTELVQRSCIAGSWRNEYDGCSVPPSIASALGMDKDNPAGGSDTQFAFGIPSSRGGRACDRHDECYQTCNPFGKAACDLRMFWDMVSVCNRSSEPASVKARCLTWANTYYQGLTIAGFPAFAERQAQVCGC